MKYSSKKGGIMFNRVQELVEDIRNGKMVILVDDEERENEGDLVCAADHVTPQMINFMASEARGLICLALDKKQIESLRLPLMVKEDENETPNKTAFTVSIEAASGVSTGISAADRAHTIKIASSRQAKSSDIRTPGHVFPIKAQDGGVLKRAGHTEGSVDLAKLAGLAPAAVICEVMNSDGSMARVPDLKKFAEKHSLKIGTIVDLIEYRLANESLVEEVFSQKLPDELGASLTVKVFKSVVEGYEHLVLQKGEIRPDKACLVRVHVENKPKDLLASLVKGKSSIDLSHQMISQSESGVLLILQGPEKHNSIVHDLNEMLNPKEVVKPSTNSDIRDYGIGAQILRKLGVHQMNLLSRRPEKRVGLKAYGLEIVEVIQFKG
jgi:3,4-dihydroxy 2-butanone 4-phosphate synthase/GTP cyclohydrolase II